MDAKDFSIDPQFIKILKGDKKTGFNDGEPLSCSCCGYVYTTWDMFLAISDTVKFQCEEAECEEQEKK